MNFRTPIPSPAFLLQGMFETDAEAEAELIQK